MSGADLTFLDEARHQHARRRRLRGRAAYLVPAAVTAVWLVGVLVTGSWQRALASWPAFPTMLFGAFVAGATPEGGGAVAFPVFTKALGIPSEVARTFSLCIQTVGMGSAALVLWIRGARISWRGIGIALGPSLTGFFLGLALLSRHQTPFWSSPLPGPVVKVSFTLLVLSTATVVYLGTRVPARELRAELDPLRGRQVVLLCVMGLVGGVASSQLGTGADVFFYIAMVVILGVDAKVGVPSSVVLMAIISTCGFVYLGLVQGHLDVTVVADQVTAVGSHPVDPATHPARRFDLLGLWLAGVPAVTWLSPLGAAFAARITPRQLAGFVACLAAAEAISTIIFLRELHSDHALQAFAVLGGALVLGTLWWASRNRALLGGVRVDPEQTLTRDRVEAGDEYRRQQP